MIIKGKDPSGKVKYANVTESGDLRVQPSGTIKEQIDRMIELQEGIGKEYTIYDGVPTTKDVIIELQEGNFAIVEVERLKVNSVSLQVSNDGVNWYSVSAKSMQTGHTANGIFTTGRYVVNITGSRFVRCSLYYQQQT